MVIFKVIFRWDVLDICWITKKLALSFFFTYIHTYMCMYVYILKYMCVYLFACNIVNWMETEYTSQVDVGREERLTICLWRKFLFSKSFFFFFFFCVIRAMCNIGLGWVLYNFEGWVTKGIWWENFLIWVSSLIVIVAFECRGGYSKIWIIPACNYVFMVVF